MIFVINTYELIYQSPTVIETVSKDVLKTCITLSESSCLLFAMANHVEDEEHIMCHSYVKLCKW
jgi:hypothetical protein